MTDLPPPTLTLTRRETDLLAELWGFVERSYATFSIWYDYSSGRSSPEWVAGLTLPDGFPVTASAPTRTDALMILSEQLGLTHD